MNRLNSEGIPRDQLGWALSQPSIVNHYRKLGKCMLCLRPGVNEAGVCEVCNTLLESPERDQVQRWIIGIGP